MMVYVQKMKIVDVVIVEGNKIVVKMDLIVRLFQVTHQLLLVWFVLHHHQLQVDEEQLVLVVDDEHQ